MRMNMKKSDDEEFNSTTGQYHIYKLLSFHLKFNKKNQFNIMRIKTYDKLKMVHINTAIIFQNDKMAFQTWKKLNIE